MITILIILIVIFLSSILLKSTFSSGYALESSDYIKPVVYNNIITPEEADYILKKANGSFSDSKIVGGFDTSIRKSKTTWLYKDDPVIYNIIKRVCDIINFTTDNAEALQVVKYEPGGFYNDHHDSCCDESIECKEFVKNGGQRILTMLIYLNDDFTGGETKFSKLNIDIKPPKYGGVLFKPLEKNGNKCHPYALHRGTPVLTGIKYICNVWIREKKFNL
jgi:prolyl 4-hydroxylase